MIFAPIHGSRNYSRAFGWVHREAPLLETTSVSGCRGMLAKQLEFYADHDDPDHDEMYAADNAAMLGSMDLTFKFLTQAYERRHGVVELSVEPELDNIRSDSRCADLLRRTG